MPLPFSILPLSLSFFRRLVIAGLTRNLMRSVVIPLLVEKGCPKGAGYLNAVYLFAVVVVAVLGRLITAFQSHIKMSQILDRTVGATPCGRPSR
jgi:hypothetical protein